MRVLITTAPALGHFHPLVPLARALVNAGHDILVASPATLRPAVDATGLPFAEVGTAQIPAGLQQRMRDASRDWRTRMHDAQTHWFLGFRARSTAPDVLRLVDAWRPDLVLRDHADYSGYVAAELREIPHASGGAAWFKPPWLHDAVVEGLAALRAEFELAPDPTAASIYRYLALASFPPSWVAPDETVPSIAHFLRAEPFNTSGNEGLPERVCRLPSGRPTVHASLGTLFNDTPGVNEAILAGLRDEPLNLVLTIGRQHDPAAFGSQPTNVIIERYIPHELLLPHCDAMLTHCGLNSIMACLALGIPMVAVPLTADQPRNAARLAALGAAVVIEPSERSPEALRAATWEVLTNPTYRATARRLRDEIGALPGSEHGVLLLERLARERQAIPAGTA